MSDSEDPFIYEFYGKEQCDEEGILALFLQNNVLFANDYEIDGKRTIVLYVNCSDVFAWACADAEPLSCSQIINLYKFWKSDNEYGPIKWCCIQRNQRPQGPVERNMKESGSWDEVMEALPANIDDARIREMMAKKGESIDGVKGNS